jgi:hypothetical protein
MSYLDRLKAKNAEMGLPSLPSKPTKPPLPSDCWGFGGFVGCPSDPNSQVTSAEEAEIRGHLARLCGADHPDYPEALAVALADPLGALDALRNPSARMLAALEGGR